MIKLSSTIFCYNLNAQKCVPRRWTKKKKKRRKEKLRESEAKKLIQVMINIYNALETASSIAKKNLSATQFLPRK